MPSPTKVASARNTTSVGSIESSWVTDTPRASVAREQKMSTFCSEIKRWEPHLVSILPLALEARRKSRYNFF